jgi:hypothetical protein
MRYHHKLSTQMDIHTRGANLLKRIQHRSYDYSLLSILMREALDDPNIAQSHDILRS